MLARLKRDLVYLSTKAEHPVIDGEPCIFWPKPIEGKWRDNFGGEFVKTLHNANGWSVGLALVDFYRHDGTKEYLPLIDGIYNWTKHFVWTRNEFADVPSSPFAIGGTLSAAFLLDYALAFQHDAARSGRAKEAVELARKITYRYMVAWACDSDHDDNLDPSFLWEPNSGRDWTGAACANEVHWNLDTLTQVYVNCGDPILNYYLRGALERWPQLYKDLTFDSLAEYSSDALSEWFGLFDGTMAGRGGRASFGTADILPMHYPVGNSVLRVTCGTKAAFACCKGGVHTQIENYRYAPDQNFEFIVQSQKRTPFDVTVSFPFADLTGKNVNLTRAGKVHQLENQKDLVRSPDAPSYVYIKGVQNGDRICVGTVPDKTPICQIGNEWTLPATAHFVVQDGAFKMIPLPLDTPLSKDWDDTSSFAGLWSGIHHAWSVPFHIVSEPASSSILSATKPCAVELPASAISDLFVFFSPTSDKGSVIIQPPSGTKIIRTAADAALAWSSWPPAFKQRILMAKVSVPDVAKIAVTPVDARLLAITSLDNADQSTRTTEVFNRGRAEFNVQLAEEQKLHALAELVAKVPAGRIGILPASNLGGPVFKAMQRSGLLKKCRQLKPEELLNAGLFNAHSLPLLLNIGGEEYAGTIKRKDDGAEAILNYLRSGGFIIMLTAQPLPFFYYDGLGQQHVPRPLTPRMGFPIALGFEQPPTGANLKIALNPDQAIITDVPKERPFFTEYDLRLRAVRREQVASTAKYTPIFTVTDANGKSLGDAAAYAEFTGGEFKGARILYVWSRFLSDQDLGPEIVEQMVKYIITQARAVPSG